MYGKFFASCFTGSMVGAGPTVFAVWGYVISHTCDSLVELNPKLVAAAIGGITPQDVESAIEFLSQPDPTSRNKEHEGRRLIRVGEFAYHVVSHKLYQSIKDEEEKNIGLPIGNPPLPAAPKERKPRGRKRIKITKLKPEAVASFEIVWDGWPRGNDGKYVKGDRIVAEERFQAILDDGAATAEELVECAKLYCEHHPNVKNGFILAVSTFFNLERGRWMEAIRHTRAAAHREKYAEETQLLQP